MRYQLTYSGAARRALAGLPRVLQRRVVIKIEALGDNPRPPGSIKLSGDASYRIRVGDYRVIYAIEDQKLVVLIIDIGHRRDVYRRM